MTPVGAGAWWDPEDETTPAARTASHPRSRIEPRPAACDGPGATGEPVHEAAASRWWTIAFVSTGALAVMATVFAVLRSDGWWASLAVVLVVTVVLLAVIEGRQPRRVSASSAGVEVSSRHHAEQVPWERLRRVRGPRAVGFARLDTDLELDTGELVRLPRRTPGGVVEGWRERHQGDRPAPRLPQVWRLSPQEAMQQFSLLHNGGLFAGLMVMNLTNASFDLPLPAFVVAYITVLWLLTLLLWRRPVRAIRVDEHGLTLPRWRHKRIQWSQVTDVRRKGRYESQVVVEVSPDGQHEILGPDVDVVTGWWHLAVPADRRPGPADG